MRYWAFQIRSDRVKECRRLAMEARCPWCRSMIIDADARDDLATHLKTAAIDRTRACSKKMFAANEPGRARTACGAGRPLLAAACATMKKSCLCLVTSRLVRAVDAIFLDFTDVSNTSIVRFSKGQRPSP